jgi:hypothetical protein
MKPTFFLNLGPVTSFEFMAGGSFLLDNKLNKENIASIIRILACIVTYYFIDDKYKKKNERAIPDLLAEIFIWLLD